VIFNNDDDDIWAHGADTPEKFLGVRHDPVDGVELDWLRAPFCFRSHCEGGEVSGRQDAAKGHAAPFQRSSG